MALITALVAPYFVNWSEYRTAFEREASRILGQPVTVSGDASARLLPFPSVTFNDVRVGPEDNPLIVARRFSMDAELAPFLSGEVLIFDMRLEEPRITVDLDERGLPDWRVPDTIPVSPAQITLEEARIVNGTMVLHDRIADRDWMLDGFSATVSADGLFGQWRIEGDGRLNGWPLGFRVSTGNLSKDGFALKTTLDLSRQGIEVALDGRVAEPEGNDKSYNGTFSVRPRSQQVSRYLVEGVFAASPRSVSVPEYRAEFGAQEDPYVVTGKGELSGGASPEYSVEVKGTQITLAEMRALQEGGEQETPQGPVTVSERLAVLQSVLSSLPFPPIPGSIDVDLPAIVAGDTTIREVRLAASPDDSIGADSRRRWKLSRFEAQLPGRTTLEADGILQLPMQEENGVERAGGFAGNVLVASRQPSGLATWLTGDADEAIRRLPNAGLSATVDISPGRQTISDLEVILGAARMNGSLVRNSDPKRRNTLKVSLAGDAIELEQLEALAAVFVGGDGAARFSDHDLDVSLDLTRPDINGVVLESMVASVRSREKRTEIDRLLINGLFGASVSATASLESGASATRAAIDATVVALDGGRFIAGAAERFPKSRALSALGEVARRNGAAFEDTQLDIIGIISSETETSGEASLSISGLSGGTTLSITTTAEGNVKDPDAIELSLNGSLYNPFAEKLLRQSGFDTFVEDSPGSLSAAINASGSLNEGMRTLLAMTGAEAVMTLDGVMTADILSTGFTGDLSIAAGDIEPWAQALGVYLPGMGLGTTADIAATLSRRAGKSVVRDMAATLNGSRVTGDLTIDTPDGTPVVRGELAFEAIDLGQLFAVISGDGEAAILDAPADDMLNRRFEAPILADNDVEVEFSVAEAAFPVGDAMLTDLSGRFIYRGGAMTFREVKGEFGDGTFAGSADVQNNQSALIVTGRIDGKDIDIETLAPPLAGHLSGTTDVAMQISANGRSIAGLLSSTTGSGVVSTGPLDIGGLSADGFTEMLAAADAIGYEITPAQIEELAETAYLDGRATLPPVEAPLGIANGKISIANLTATTGALTVAANAQANLSDGTISGTAILSLDPGKESVAGPQPEIALAFRSAEDGFSVTRDFGPVTGFLTQRALEREQARVEALQARLLEKQRLRREVQLYRYRKQIRLQAAEEARLREFGADRARVRENDARRRALAAEEAARRISSGEAQRPQAEPARLRQTPAAPALELDKLIDALPETIIRQPLGPVN